MKKKVISCIIFAVTAFSIPSGIFAQEPVETEFVDSVEGVDIFCSGADEERMSPDTENIVLFGQADNFASDVEIPALDNEKRGDDIQALEEDQEVQAQGLFAVRKETDETGNLKSVWMEWSMNSEESHTLFRRYRWDVYNHTWHNISVENSAEELMFEEKGEYILGQKGDGTSLVWYLEKNENGVSGKGGYVWDEKNQKYDYYLSGEETSACQGFLPEVPQEIYVGLKDNIENHCGLQAINGNTYFINKDGTLFKDGNLTIEGRTYCFDSAGVCIRDYEYVTPGWKKIKKGVYRWRLEDGSYLEKKGWQTLAGKVYYLNADYTRKTGFLKLKGKTYYLNPSLTYGVARIGGKTYLFDKKTGEALKGWQKIGKKKCFMLGNGTMATQRWIKYNNNYYYMGKSGAMVKGERWLNINGSRYYLRKNGSRATGLYTIKGKKYYFSKNGKLVTNKTSYAIGDDYYDIAANGVMTKLSAVKVECSIAAQNFIARHTNAGMSNAQKFRTCFNYIMAYTNFQPWINPTAADFKRDDWPHEAALNMFQSSLSGSCYGIASCVAAVAKELGYEPYVIAITADHCFVTIDGLYYDNMGALFGASSHFPYEIASKVKF